MTPHEGGRFCGTCARTVIDLRRATETEGLGLTLLHARDGRACVNARIDDDGFVHLRSDEDRDAGRRPRGHGAALVLAAALSQTVACGAGGEFGMLETAGEAPAAPPPPYPLAPARPGAPVVGCPRPPLIATDPLSSATGGVGVSPLMIGMAMAEIDAESVQLIDAVAYALRQHPEIQLVDVIGHADVFEMDADQKATLRAQVVFRMLIERGISAERLRLLSAGTTAPAASSATPEGRAANKRVTFAVAAP